MPCAVNHKVQLAVLPGDDKPDPGLDRFSTISRQDRDALWHYLARGRRAERRDVSSIIARSLIDGKDKPQEAAPLVESRVVAGRGSARAIAGRIACDNWQDNASVVAHLFLPRTGAERADAAGREL